MANFSHTPETLELQAVSPDTVEAAVCRPGDSFKTRDGELADNGETAKEVAGESGDDKVYGLTDQTNRLPPLRVALVFFVLGDCVLLSALEASIIATSLSTIASALNAGTQASWIVTVYLLTQCALCPCWSRLSDILGRKVLLNFCICEFLVMSLGCALAPNISMLLAFRALQGIGGGALLVLAQAICLDIVTIRERSKYQVIFEAMMTLGNGIGPILGGVFAGTNWRWCFWINLPFGVMALVLSVVFIPVVPVTGHWKLKLKQIDFVGCWLVAVASVLILLGMSWGGVTYSWTSAVVLVVLVLGVALWVGFCFWESKGALIPILPMRLFRIPTVVAVMNLSFLSSGMNCFLLIFYVPQFLQLVRGFSPIRSGVFLLAFLVPITTVVFISALIVVKTGRYRELIFLGLALSAISIGLISTVDASTSEIKILGYLIFAGAALGPTLQTSLIAAQAVVQKRDLTVVTGTRIFMKQIGGLFGVAVASSLVQNQVAQAPVDPLVVREILDNPERLQDLDPATAQLVLDCYKKGFRQVFLGGAVVGAVAFVVAVLLIQHRTLDGGKEEEETKTDGDVVEQK